MTQQEREVEDDEEEDDDVVDCDEDEPGLFDREDLDENARPVRMLLVKVSQPVSF